MSVDSIVASIENEDPVAGNVLRTYTEVWEEYHAADEAYCNDVIKTLRPTPRSDEKTKEIADLRRLLDEMDMEDVRTEGI